MMDYLDSLNPRQREAVEYGDGPLLILAGAGSGKTRVISCRIAHLIQARGVAPERILGVTFTNKAAGQMKERVAGLLGGNTESGPLLSTFHSFCVRVLRRHIERLGYTKAFAIYDEDDQLRAVKACLEDLGLSDGPVTPRAALSRISYAKNRGLSPESLYSQAVDGAGEKIATIFERYEQKLRQANALDFDDLLIKTVALFDQAPEVAQSYNHRIEYLLVDEYQDTNRLQNRLIRLLTELHRNLCVVGDEDQSIYSWRGAEVENILRFEKDFPGTRIIRLEQNYRSTQAILDAASAVVSRNLARLGKQLRAVRDAGRRIGLYEGWDAEEEAAFVAGEIKGALARDSTSSAAVLYRTNAQSRAFEEALRREAIDYRLVGGFSFYARAEIRDVLSYARLAGNLSDSVALFRILNVPPRGLGDVTAKAVAARARGRGQCAWQAIAEMIAGDSGGLSTRALHGLTRFSHLVNSLARERELLTPREFIRHILEASGYLEMLRAERSPEADERLENLRELVNAAAEAEDRGESLAEFLDHAALVSDADGYDERARVTLMTLHSAKGLEFDLVFLAGLEEGVFPHRLSRDDPAGLEEERRLCYVGMTRARDRLTMTWVRHRRAFAQEGAEEGRPSRFLSEVPAELVEPLSALAQPAKARTVWAGAVNSVDGLERALTARRKSGSSRSFSSGQSATRLDGNPRWRRGVRVRHAKYGIGTILQCEGAGEDTKLTVSFPGYGEKKLMEKYATLEKI